MATIDWTPFEAILDESVTVICEEFKDTIAGCSDVEDVCLAIGEAIKSKKVDFIKIIALCLAGEVLRAR